MSFLNDIKKTINPVTIDQFKATIGKRGGTSVGSRYSVTMSPPTHTLLDLDVNNMVSSALSGNLNWRQLVNDPRDINILCESCKLPGRAVQTGDYDAHNRANRKYPSGIVEEDVEFTFLLTNDYYAKKFFDRWMGSVIDPVTELINYRSEYATDVWIQQLDKNNTPIYGVKLLNAFPIGVSGVALSNESGSATQSVSVSMTYERFELEGSIKSTIDSTLDKIGILRRLI